MTGRGFFFLACACLCTAATATTLAPVSLDEQIGRAEQVFRGRVESIRGELVSTGAGRKIVSRVTFSRTASYKGGVPEKVELTFLGGKVGDLEMRVDGMPRFEVGTEYVLFVSGDENRACPVVGWELGCLRVDSNAGTVKLSAPVAQGLSRGASARAAPSVSGEARSEPLSEFESGLRARIREVSGK